MLAGTTACARREVAKKQYSRPLPVGEIALREVDVAVLPAITTTPQSRQDLKLAIDLSLGYLKTPTAQRVYNPTVGGLPLGDVAAGLTLMKALLDQYPDDAALNREVAKRFRVFQSIGCDDVGTVLFTGYYTPVLSASRERTADFRYPIYKRPADLSPNPNPSQARTTPARRISNGAEYGDAATLLNSGELTGTELAWLSDPWQAYLVQVQGSAVLRTPEGDLLVGYHDTNGHPYVSIARELVKDGKIEEDKISMPTLMAYFRAHPDEVEPYIQRNPRMIFFRVTDRGGPFGSIGVPVTADVSIATDKTIFPPGGLSVVDTPTTRGHMAMLRVDQDTGGAIRAPGKCDLYMGVGPEAEARAGGQYAEGRLFYLVPK